MPTSIDESGDTGHARNSLPYFRLAAVWIPTLDAAESFRENVRALRRCKDLGSSFEFKFSRTSSRPDLRQAFFDLALRHPFRFAVCAIDKTRGHWRSATAQEQHWAAATSLAACLRTTYHRAEKQGRPLREPILVDDNGDQKFLYAIETAFRGLRSSLNSDAQMVQKPRFRGSRPDEIMHLVDMVCGAAGAAIDGCAMWYELIKERSDGLIRLP